MARITLDEIRGLGDMTQVFRWVLLLKTAPTAVPNFPTTGDLDLRVETSELPKKTGSTVEITLKGHTVRYPGIYKPSGTISMAFVEAVDSKVAQWLASWQQACWADNTGTRGSKDSLTAVWQLQLLNNDDSVRWVYELKGCFLEDSNPGQLDGTSPDPFKPQLTMSFDDFKQGSSTAF